MNALRSFFISLSRIFGKYHIFLFGLIFVFFIFFRLYVYHPLSYSIGFNDTNSYLEASRVEFPSWSFFTSYRPPTLPIIFKILQPPKGYQFKNLSSPYEGKLGFPTKQRGFDLVVILQAVLSVFSWSTLVFVLYRNTIHPLVKLILASIVFLFAFTPQMAGWDCILGSESISFSLYVLLIALCIQFTFYIINSTNGSKIQILILASSILFVMAFWVFTRDTNSYAIPITIIFALPLVIWIYKRKSKSLTTILVAMVFTSAIFSLQQISFRQSPRWIKPLLNNMTTNVFPYPQRVEFFVRQGMPTSESLLNLQGSAEYNGIYDYTDFMSWVKEKGLSSYTKFLISTPLWISTSIFRDSQFLFSENLQPFYSIKTDSLMRQLIPLGDFLHPLSSSVILINSILLLILIFHAVKTREARWIVWSWIAGWIFISSFTLMTFGYLGEVRSVLRHSMAGVVPMRLLLWILLGLTADTI